jgi:hypothetical protein
MARTPLHRHPAARDHRPGRCDPHPRLGPAAPPEPSLPAIVDIARLATQIEATRFRLTARDIPLTAQNAPKAGAWHRIWTGLRGLRGLTGPQPDIREHAHAVQDRLRDLLHPQTDEGAAADDVTARRATLDPQLRRDLAAVLRDAGDQLAQTAPWTHTALHRLAQTGNLYVPAGPAEIGQGTLRWEHGRPIWAPALIPQDKIRAVDAAYRGLGGAYAQGHLPADPASVERGPAIAPPHL